MFFFFTKIESLLILVGKSYQNKHLMGGEELHLWKC